MATDFLLTMDMREKTHKKQEIQLEFDRNLIWEATFA